ncbi:MAG: hypothetical protein SFV21_20130, partial [Rhodospirillaceae bacterium]|nr:hypothetical protein [Rhodospirillaceae bacterium]
GDAAVAAGKAGETSLMSALGTIAFPNSGKPAAQDPFLTGVKAFYSFEFDEAGEAFRAAQAADPGFALAYWGEAMSYNHPLWAEQDFVAARRTLNRFAPTPEARAQKTPAGLERDLMQAVDVLYGEGDKRSRDEAYLKAMRRLLEVHPDNDEVAALTALSLMATVRPGEPNLRRLLQAGALAQSVFARNPNHPGAAHFIIHAFDDPDHAILALPAARAYAGIAPDAPHALHMPSHIFVQLGMWDGVVASNDAAYKAAVAHAARKNLTRGRDDFHALSWLQYGNLMLGRFDAARENLAWARATERDHPNARVHDGVLSMLARYVIETGRWNEMPLDIAPVAEKAAEHGGEHAKHRDGGNVDLQFAAGLAAARLGKADAAERALANIAAARAQAEKQPAGAYRAKTIAVVEHQLAAEIAAAKGDASGAEARLKQAVALEATMDPPSGPPQPMKPSFEQYGEFLLAAGRTAEAAAQFEQAMLRTPNRTPSVRGLAQARPQAAETAVAR